MANAYVVFWNRIRLKPGYKKMIKVHQIPQKGTLLYLGEERGRSEIEIIVENSRESIFPQTHLLEACDVIQTKRGYTLKEQQFTYTDTSQATVLVRTGTGESQYQGRIEQGEHPPILLNKGINRHGHEEGLYWFKNFGETLVIHFSNARIYLLTWTNEKKIRFTEVVTEQNS